MPCCLSISHNKWRNKSYFICFVSAVSLSLTSLVWLKPSFLQIWYTDLKINLYYIDEYKYFHNGCKELLTCCLFLPWFQMLVFCFASSSRCSLRSRQSCLFCCLRCCLCILAGCLRISTNLECLCTDRFQSVDLIGSSKLPSEVEIVQSLPYNRRLFVVVQSNTSKASMTTRANCYTKVGNILYVRTLILSN